MIAITFNPKIHVTQAIFVLTSCIILHSCGGGEGDDGERPVIQWVRIDSPDDGLVTSRDFVTVEGNAGVTDGSYPGAVFWTNNGNSGNLLQSTLCILGCILGFDGEVPLTLGENVISVHLDNAKDTVTVTRYPQVVVSGTVRMDTSFKELVPGVTFMLTGGFDWNIYSETGEYNYPYVRDGSYSVSATLLPAQSDCLSFYPDRYDFDVIDDNDISGLDFLATETVRCYEIRGTVFALSSYDQALTLTDVDDNDYRIQANRDGEFVFYHIGPGTYTITPSGGYGAYYSPESRTVTITDSDRTYVDFSEYF